MRIGLLSDTHGFLDESLFEHFAECDEVWHAGDVGSVEIVDRLAAFKPLRGVFGNVDGSAVRAALPEEIEWECAGLRVFMTHIGGPPAKKELERRKPQIFVCGHSHIFKVAREKDYVYVNPGAAGNHGWHRVRTALMLTLESGGITAAKAIELGPRGRRGA